MRLRSGLYAGQFFQNKLIKPSHYLALWVKTGCSSKLEAQFCPECLGMLKQDFSSLPRVAQCYHVPFFTVYTIHPGILQTQTCPSDCQMKQCDLSLHKTRSTVPKSRVLYTTPSNAWHCISIRLACSCSAMKTHSIKLLLHSFCASINASDVGSLQLQNQQIAVDLNISFDIFP